LNRYTEDTLVLVIGTTVMVMGMVAMVLGLISSSGLGDRYEPSGCAVTSHQHASRCPVGKARGR